MADMRKQKKIDPKMKIVNKTEIKDIGNESSVFKTPETKAEKPVQINVEPQRTVETGPETPAVQATPAKPKKKRKMSAKQLENLAKGRAKSLQNRREKRRLKEIEYAERNGIPIDKVKKTWTEKQIEKKYEALARKEKLQKYDAEVKPVSQKPPTAPKPQNPVSFTPEMFNKYMNDWVANEQRKERARRPRANNERPRQASAPVQSRNTVVNHSASAPISHRSQYRYSVPFQGLSKSQQANRGRHNGSSWGL